MPQLTAQIPALNNTPGNQVMHTFQARKVHCILTIQWACGTPIAWGKCYKSESLSQVLQFIETVWDADDNEMRPSFIAYDKACDLLSHIATQDPESKWLRLTSFVVDAWHYTGHKASDLLCRTWCNPAPADGSQADLIRVETDNHGRKVVKRAFNTETAEQLNAWLNGFEAQTRQMTDVSFDFFIQSLMLLYSESIGMRINRKGQTLP
jgi:hypothetical protein